VNCSAVKEAFNHLKEGGSRGEAIFWLTVEDWQALA